MPDLTSNVPRRIRHTRRREPLRPQPARITMPAGAAGFVGEQYAERLAEVGSDPTLFALFGEGFLAITFDQEATSERYQGIVPLEGASIGEAAEHYFEQSEQISSLIRLAARHDAEAGCVAGGLLLQHLPEGEQPDRPPLGCVCARHTP